MIYRRKNFTDVVGVKRLLRKGQSDFSISASCAQELGAECGGGSPSLLLCLSAQRTWAGRRALPIAATSSQGQTRHSFEWPSLGICSQRVRWTQTEINVNMQH